VTPGDPLAIIARTPAALRALLASFPDDALLAPRDDGWSVRDALAHILDADSVIYRERITRMVDEDRPFIRSIDPTARVAERGYNRISVPDLLDALEESRAGTVAAARALSAAELGRAGQHDTAGEISVANLLHQWAYHDLMHLKQIAAILQAPLVEPMGNTRRFYDI
jgi:hypothetical protein